MPCRREICRGRRVGGRAPETHPEAPTSPEHRTTTTYPCFEPRPPQHILGPPGGWGPGYETGRQGRRTRGPGQEARPPTPSSAMRPASHVPLCQPSRTSCSRCASLEDSMGGKCSRKACCLSGRRAGTNLQGTAAHSSLPRRGRGGCATAQRAEAVRWGWGAPSPGCCPPAGGPPTPPPAHSPAPPRSLVIADADDRPHQEPPLSPAPPPPTRGNRTPGL